MDDDLYELEPYHLLCTATGSLFLRWARFENILSADLKAHLESQLRRRRDQKDGLHAYRLSAAIYGGMRLGYARDTMKRIMAEEDFGEPHQAFFKATFDHIGHVEDLRDKLAHQLFDATDDPHVWELCDVMTTRKLRGMKRYHFSTEAVFHASYDLGLAADRMDRFMLKPKGFDLTPIAWRYKPSMLKLLPKRKRPSPQSPPRPPRSSRG